MGIMIIWITQPLLKTVYLLLLSHTIPNLFLLHIHNTFPLNIPHLCYRFSSHCYPAVTPYRRGRGEQSEVVVTTPVAGTGGHTLHTARRGVLSPTRARP